MQNLTEDQAWCAVLTKNWARIVKGLEPIGSITDVLISHGVFTPEIHEELNAKPTRKQRAQLLLSRLCDKRAAEIKFFIEHLESEHLFLYKDIIARRK